MKTARRTSAARANLAQSVLAGVLLALASPPPLSAQLSGEGVPGGNLGPPSHRQESQDLHAPLDLRTVVAMALKGNPALQAQQERRQEVAGGVREARADAFPQFTLNASWDQTRNPSLLNSVDFEDFVESFPGGRFVPGRQELFTLSAEVRQPLFTWGKVRAALRLADSVGQVAEAQIEEAQLEAAVAAAENLYEVLSARSSLAALEAQKEARQEALDVAQARYDLQDATRLDLLRAETAFARVQPELERARGRIAVAESRLRRSLGLNSGDLRFEQPTEDGLPALGSLEDLQAQARACRPELRDLAGQVQALGHQSRVIAADGKPRLDFSGSYGRVARLPDDLADPLFRDWRMAVELRWQFFDGGRRRGQIEQFQSQQRQLEWGLRDLELRIAEEVASAYAEVASATARWRAALDAARSAEEARRVAAESYAEGVALQLDLLDAQEQATQAELERIQAYFDTLARWARLHRSLGLLPSLPGTGTGSVAPASLLQGDPS